MAVQRFSGFSMLHQGLQSFVRPGSRAACSSKKHQRESDDMPKFNVFTGWFDFRKEVSDSSSLPCRKDAKILLQTSNLPENCTFVWKTMGLRRWVGKSDLQPWSNLRRLWVLEEQNQHNVTCYNSKRNDKWRSYHGRSTVFRVFDAAPRAFILCQTRAAGSLFLQKTSEGSRWHPEV